MTRNEPGGIAHTAPTRQLRNQRPAPLLATTALIALAAIVPIVIWSIGSPRNITTEFVLTLTTVVAGVRFSWVLGARYRHLHEMVLWLFVYTFLGVAPLIQYRTKFPGTTPMLDLNFGTEAALVVLLGSIALICGSTWAARTEPSPRWSHLDRPSQVNPRNTYIWTVICLGLAGAYIARVGPTSLFSSRSDLKASQAESLGNDPLATLVTAATRMGLVVAFVALMHVRAQRKAEGRPPLTVLPTVVFITLFMVINPVSSARYTFGTAALAALGALGAYATVTRFRVVAVGALAGLVVLFPLLDTFRRSSEATFELQGPVESMTTGDFDAFAQIINTVELVASQGLAWGYQLAGPFLFWIPRSIWPGKPIDTGIELAEFKGYGFQNLSAPLWSEFFINFGWVGVIVGMFLVGYLLRVLDSRAEIRLQLSPLPGVLACITPFYLLILLRGSLLQAMVNLFVIVGVSWWVTRPSHQQKASTRHT